MRMQSPTSEGCVSCRITSFTIRQLISLGLPTAHVTAETGFTLEDFQQSASFIPWDSFVAFFENVHRNLPPDQFVTLCTSYDSSPLLRPLLLAAGLWFSPARYFDWVADPERGAIQQLFRCLETRITHLGGRELILEERLRPGFRLPPDVFWESQAIGFAALTMHFGFAPSVVTWAPIDRGASFRVRLPRRRPLRTLLAKVAFWLRRETTEDLRAILQYGHERSVRLEREISDRKRVELALRASEELLHKVTDAIPGAVYRYYLDRDGSQGFGFVSGRAAALTGFTAEELIARPELMWQQILPEYVPEVRESIAVSARDLTPWQQDFRIATKAGEVRWLRGQSIPEPPDGTGRVIWNGIMTDVTAERTTAEAAEAAMRGRDEVLRKLSEQVPGVIYQYRQWPDGRGDFPYASEGIRDIYEVNPDEARESAESVFNRIHADDLDAVVATITLSQESLEEWRCEYRVLLPTRGERWLDGHSVPERLPDGSTLWHGYISDITDRKRAEAALRESEERLRLFVEYVPAGVVMLDRELRYLSFSRRWLTDYKLGDQDLRGRCHYDLFPDVPERWKAIHQRCLLGVSERCDRDHFVRADGSSIYLRWEVQPWFEAGGGVGGLVFFTEDITEQVQAELALRESEERQRIAIQATRLGIWRHDVSADTITLDASARRLFDLDQEVTRPAELQARFHPDDRDRVSHEVAGALSPEGTGLFETEHRVVTREGEVRWLAVQAQIGFTEVPVRRAISAVGSVLDITERKRIAAEVAQARDAAQNALARVEIEAERAERFFRLVEFAGQGIGIARPDGSLLYINPCFRQMLELAPDAEITRHAFWEFVPPENHRFLAEQVLATTREVGYWTGDFEMLTATGRRVPILNNVFLMRDQDGAVVGYANVATDLRSVKEAEERLRVSEDRLQQVVRCAEIGVFDHNHRTGEIYWSPQQRAIHGWPQDEPVRLDAYLAMVHPDDREETAAAIRRAHDPAGDGAFDVILRIVRRNDGQTRWVLHRSRTIFEGAGANRRPVRTYGAVMDVTDRKQAEDALHESESRQQLALDAGRMGTWDWDIVHNRQVWDARQRELLGMPLQEVEGDTARFYERVHPDDVDAVRAAVNQSFATGEDYVTEFRVLPGGGDVRWLHARGRLLKDASGRPSRMVGINTDITPQKKVMIALQESEYRTRLALDAGRMGTWAWEIGTDRLDWDDREEALFGFPPGGFDNRLTTFLGRIHPDDLNDVRRVLENAVAGQDFDGEFRIVLPTGEGRWIHGTGAVRPADGHHPARLIGINYDVTDRVAAEERLRTSIREKEAMLKEIHHRVKNNLQVISSLLNLQAERLADPIARSVFLESQTRVRAMALVHENLYGSGSLAQVELSRYIDRLCDSLLQTFGGSDRVTVERVVAPLDLDLDRALPVGLIVSELVSNALKYAFPDGRHGQVRVVVASFGESGCQVSVADNGVGLPVDLDIDRTTSLGMYLVQLLARQLRGKLDVDRTGGTAFTLRFAL